MNWTERFFCKTTMCPGFWGVTMVEKETKIKAHKLSKEAYSKLEMLVVHTLWASCCCIGKGEMRSARPIFTAYTRMYSPVGKPGVSGLSIQSMDLWLSKITTTYCIWKFWISFKRLWFMPLCRCIYSKLWTCHTTYLDKK